MWFKGILLFPRASLCSQRKGKRTGKSPVVKSPCRENMKISSTPTVKSLLRLCKSVAHTEEWKRQILGAFDSVTDPFSPRHTKTISDKEQSRASSSDLERCLCTCAHLHQPCVSTTQRDTQTHSGILLWPWHTFAHLHIRVCTGVYPCECTAYIQSTFWKRNGESTLQIIERLILMLLDERCNLGARKSKSELFIQVLKYLFSVCHKC